MVSHRKYTRKRLKEPDEFITMFGQVVSFVSHYSKALTWTLAAISVIGLAGGWFFHSRNVAEKKMETSLSEAYFLYRQAEASDKRDFSEALRAYKAILREFPDPKKSARAYFYSGRIYSELADFQKAIQMYQKAAETSENKTLIREIAVLGLGYSHEAMAQYSQAIANYKKVVELEEASLKSEALLALGRSYEQLEDHKSARAYYTLYLSDPSVQFLEEVQEKVDRLKSLP